MNAAGERRLAGISQVFFRAPVFGKIGLGIEAANRGSGDRGEAGVAVLIEIGAGGRADRLFRGFFQSREESFFRPVLFA